MNTVNKSPSANSQTILSTLKTAVSKVMEQKKRLGQYAVIWQDNKPTLVGEDAPQIK